jgi:RNA polymerase sigma-70 factor (ECF subfamily)
MLSPEETMTAESLPTRSFGEEELVAHLRARDETAFRWLVSEHHAALTRIAALYVGAADVDEVVQETWAAVVAGINGFSGRSTLKTWIYQILLNQARRRFRREKRTIPFAAGGPGEAGWAGVDPNRLMHEQLGANYWTSVPRAWHSDPEGRLLGREVRQLLLTAIDRLGDAQREVITLRDIAGWTSEEVCDALRISAANQRVLLHRARTAVRDALEGYFDGE